MQGFIIFYTDFPILFHGGFQLNTTTLQKFEQGKKYKILDRFETSDWDINHLLIELDGKPIQIKYHIDDFRNPNIKRELRLDSGLISELSTLPDYELLDIQEYREELLEKILKI
jgi:hypothetical protein